MIKETKILLNNIRNFRKAFLKESVGGGSIRDAIEKRKIIYMYYTSTDDDENISGARTIKPMVYGRSTAGNEVVRAWQEAGGSWSDMNNPGGNKYPDAKGRMKPGWRLFRLDGITSFLPTGKYFSANDDKIPNGYNPEDSQMTDIWASVQPQSKEPPQITGLASPTTANVEKNMVQMPPKSLFATQAEKFKYFSDAAKKTREATKEEIETLYNLSKQIKKKAPSKMLVVQNEDGDMVLKDINIQDKLPEESIIGNLDNLYKKYVAAGKPKSSDFSKKVFDDTVKKLDQNQ